MNSSEHGFEYHPVLADASAFLGRAGAARFLLVGRPLDNGDGLPEGFETVPDCRHASPEAAAVLPRGNYRFESPEGGAVMLVTDGAAPCGPESGQFDPVDDSFRGGTFAWFQHYWGTADLIPKPRFALHNDVVTVPGGRETTVRGRGYVGTEWRYRIRLDGVQQLDRTGRPRRGRPGARGVSVLAREQVARRDAPAVRL
ncbi:MAG: hypothetical protein OXG91_07040 [bacterium]|nr:hypothetical protein [bacterium]